MTLYINGQMAKFINMFWCKHAYIIDHIYVQKVFATNKNLGTWGGGVAGGEQGMKKVSLYEQKHSCPVSIPN